MVKLIKFFIFVLLLAINSKVVMAQSNGGNINIISSPDKMVAASAQNGINAIQIINSPGLGFASTLNISLVTLGLAIATIYVWDPDSNSTNVSSSSTTTN